MSSLCSEGAEKRSECSAGAGIPAVDEELLEQVFGKSTADEGDNFLKNYIARQAWDEDAEDNHVPLHEKVYFLSNQLTCMTSFH